MKQQLQRISMLVSIFWVFCRIGPSTFGGGYAMIPIIEREIVKKRNWLKESDMSDLISIAGSAPGGVGVNSAAFIGYRLSGVGGAVMAVLGITLPPVVIVFALSSMYSLFSAFPKVEAALKGIHAAIIALILIAAYRMAKSSLIDKTTATVAVVSLGLLIATPIHPLLIIAVGIIAGVLAVKIKSMLGVSAPFEKASAPDPKPEIMFPEYYI